jgi:hypothetical protein
VTTTASWAFRKLQRDVTGVTSETLFLVFNVYKRIIYLIVARLETMTGEQEQRKNMCRNNRY